MIIFRPLSHVRAEKDPLFERNIFGGARITLQFNYDAELESFALELFIGTMIGPL